MGLNVHLNNINFKKSTLLNIFLTDFKHDEQGTAFPNILIHDREDVSDFDPRSMIIHILWLSKSFQFLS